MTRKPAMRLILISGLTIVIIAGIILGYGFFHAWRLRVYAQRVSHIMSTSHQDWTYDNLAGWPSLPNATLKTEADKMKASTTKSLNQVSSLKSLPEAGNLPKYLREYFVTSMEISQQALVVLNYNDILEQVKSTLATAGTTVANVNDYQKILKHLHDGIDKAISQMETAKAPPHYENYHKQYIDLLKRTEKVLAEGMKTTSKTSLSPEVSQEIALIQNDLGQLQKPDVKALITEITMPQKRDNLKLLNKEIENKTLEMANIIFTY